MGTLISRNGRRFIDNKLLQVSGNLVAVWCRDFICTATKREAEIPTQLLPAQQLPVLLGSDSGQAADGICWAQVVIKGSAIIKTHKNTAQELIIEYAELEGMHQD